MSDYVPTNWEDEVPATTPVKYKISQASDGDIATDATIEVVTDVTPGTPVNATNLNHIEEGIDDAHDRISAHDHTGGEGAQIPQAGIANDAVDDTKVGNRVPQFYRRQGGNSSDWSYLGNINYTPGAVRIQSGVSEAPALSTINIVYPVAFSNKPILFVQGWSSGVGYRVPDNDFQISNESASGFSLYNLSIGSFSWLAIGPE